ncbi:hypothetical protein B0H14DRAFT_3170226 [Mycena olivaceomarginata]|nr:hypothetical protein B0H14DRAFT_3170226 [Mycena olivaceomarginata]
MKAESAHQARDNDPIAAAARPGPSHHAMADAQEAIAAARAEKLQASAALAECQQQSQGLKAEIGHLETLTQHQHNQITRPLCAIRRAGHGARHPARICECEIPSDRRPPARLAFIESSRRGERLGLDTEYAELETMRAALKAGEAALKTEKARLTREKNKLVKDQRAARSALAGIKRSVEDLESQFGEDDDENAPLDLGNIYLRRFIKSLRTEEDDEACKDGEEQRVRAQAHATATQISQTPYRNKYFLLDAFGPGGAGREILGSKEKQYCGGVKRGHREGEGEG